MAEVVEHCLALLRKDGPIEGTHLVHIWSLARTLANEKAAEEAAAIAMQLSSPSQAFEDLLSKSADTVNAPVQPVNADPAPPSATPAETATNELLPQGGAADFVPQFSGTLF
jgi:hypothetical protein